MTDETYAARKAAARSPRRATMDDLETATSIFSAAFSDDPVTSWIVRDDGRRDEGFRRLFHMEMKHLYIEPGWTFLGDGCASAWTPPGHKSATMSFWTELSVRWTIFQATGLSRFRRAAETERAMGAAHPKEPHAYLALLGVDPAYQGQGLGSAILAASLEQVDALGAPAYLENSNPRNTPLYLRHGFKPGDEIRATPDAPPMLALWRDAVS